MPTGPRRRPSQDMLNDIDDALHGEGYSAKSPHEKILSRAFPESDATPPRRHGLMTRDERVRWDLGAAEIRHYEDPLRFDYGEGPDTSRRWTGERYVRNIKTVSSTEQARYQDKYRRSTSPRNDLYRRKYTLPPRQSYLDASTRPGHVSPYQHSLPAHQYATAERVTMGSLGHPAGHMRVIGERRSVRGPAGPYRRARSDD